MIPENQSSSKVKEKDFQDFFVGLTFFPLREALSVTSRSAVSRFWQFVKLKKNDELSFKKTAFMAEAYQTAHF